MMGGWDSYPPHLAEEVKASLGQFLDSAVVLAEDIRDVYPGPVPGIDELGKCLGIPKHLLLFYISSSPVQCF